jgi:hypothetical protein
MAALDLLAGQRLNEESDRAVIACNDYLRLGPGRSLSKLADKYGKTKKKLAPTQSIATLTGWSARFRWQVRAAAYDAEWEHLKNERRREEMEYGLALDFERVERLKRLADFLESQLYELSKPDPLTGEQTYHNVWVPDVKSIGGGEFAERVDIERFNGPLISEYRSVLDDLAKETGGRVRKTELGNPRDDDGKPIPVTFTVIEVTKEHRDDGA